MDVDSFVFITDTHFTTSSRVRTGNLLDDMIPKLDFVVHYCEENNAILLHGGDVWDKPSVPDLVKNRIIPVLSHLTHPMLAVAGNHSVLFNNREFDYKTSFTTLCKAGLCEDLDSQNTWDFGSCLITSKVPVITRNKPQIVVFHGFLNKEDGNYTFRFDDLQTTDQVYVCLGHDHVAYEPLKYTPNIRIFRPGSFLRGIRNDEQFRTPQLLHIKVIDGKLKYKMVDIPCRPADQIFKPKEAHTTQAQKKDTYDLIIDQIRNSSLGEMSLEQALQTVADPDVVQYSMKMLEEARLEEQHKNKNL